jgi:DNA-binding response OmpR family regulator
MKKILLVEDDEFLRTLYLDLLSQKKYQVDSAEEGQTAYQKISKGIYDLILLDIILPKIDGIQIVEKLQKENPKSLKQKIIFLTNLDKNEMIQKVTQLGFSYIIKSDLNPEEFCQKVASMLKIS